MYKTLMIMVMNDKNNDGALMTFARVVGRNRKR